MAKQGDEKDPVFRPGLAARGSQRADAEFMASVYKDLVAFENEILLEVEEALLGFAASSRRRMRSDIKRLRADRDRLRRAFLFWDDQTGGSRRRFDSNTV
jgi:hypothetical protein